MDYKTLQITPANELGENVGINVTTKELSKVAYNGEIITVGALGEGKLGILILNGKIEERARNYADANTPPSAFNGLSISEKYKKLLRKMAGEVYTQLFNAKVLSILKNKDVDVMYRPDFKHPKGLKVVGINVSD